MMTHVFTEKKRQSIILGSVLLIVGLVSYAFGHTNNNFRPLNSDVPVFTLTLNESNAPNVSSSVFEAGQSFDRYVAFDYEGAKQLEGYHVALDEYGYVTNNPATQITSIQSITAVFTGGIANLTTGPSLLLMNDEQQMTSGVTVNFLDNPYFFLLMNNDDTPLQLTSLTITYTCVPYYSTITYETYGGTEIDPVTLVIGDSISSPTAPTKDGYSFDSWYEDPQFNNEYVFDVMPTESITLYAHWEFDEEYEPVLSIAEFKALAPDDTDYHFVRGVVLLAGPNLDVIIIADEDGYLPVISNAQVNIYDEVRVGGYRAMEGDFAVLEGREEDPIAVDIFAIGQPLPTSPDSLTVAAFNALDPDLSSNWVLYVEISGTISINHGTHIVTLSDGEDTLNITVIGQESYNLISDYNGLEVTFRGVILPNMDEPETTLMLLFNGHEDFIETNYSEEEMLILLEGMLRSYYEGMSYFPGQYLQLPSEHPLFPVAVEYETFGDNAQYYDLLTHTFSPDTPDETLIDIHVDMLIDDVIVSEFDIQLHVDSDIIISIATFMSMPDSTETTHIISGVILLISQMSPDSFMVMIADNTGIIRINSSSEEIAVGDKIVAIGFKMTMEGNVFMFNDPSQTINAILYHDQPLPLTPTEITLSAFNALDSGYVQSNFVFYELVGSLYYTDPENPSESMFYLSEDEVYVYIFPVDPAARSALDTYVEDVVTIVGIAAVASSPGGEMIFLYYIAYSGTLSV